MRLQFLPFYSRPTYDLPQVECLNVIAEAAPIGTVYVSRPALTRRTINVGTGPVRGIFRQPGVAIDHVFDTDGVMIVSGQQLYRRATLVGTIAGSSPVRFAGSGSQLVIVAPDVGIAYLYNTATHVLSVISDPDLPQVSDVFTMDSRFYYQHQDSDEFSFSAVGDASSIDGLAFETAEAKPDAVVRSVNYRALACFFGQNSIEVFSSSGDQNAPLAPQVSMTSNKGMLASESLALAGNTLFFVGEDRRVYAFSGGEPVVVSHSGINERLRLCTTVQDCSAYAQTFDGHEVYILTIPGQGTFAYDLAAKEWFQWESMGEGRLRISTGIMYAGESYLGDYETGQIWRFNPNSSKDFDTFIERMVTAFVPMDSGAEPCRLISLQCVRGVGDTDTPNVEMRYSDDAGRTWSQWSARSLGKVGQYGEKAIWRQLGLIRSPGRWFQFRTTENVNFVAESMTVDEQRP